MNCTSGSGNGLSFGVLARFEICQSSSLVVDVSDLSVALNVEFSDLLTSRSTEGFLEVRGEATPSTCGLVAHSVLGVHGPGRVGSLIFRIEAVQGARKSLTDTVLLIQRNGLLDDLIGHDIAMGKVFGNNSRSWLVFLVKVIIARRGGDCGASLRSDSINVASGGDTNLRLPKLRAVKEECSLCRSGRDSISL